MINHQTMDDPRLPVLPPSAIASLSQSPDAPETPETAMRCDDMFEQFKRDKAQLSQKELEEFDQERIDLKRQWTENFDQETQGLRATLQERHSREKRELETQLSLLLQKLQPQTGDPPLLCISKDTASTGSVTGGHHKNASSSSTKSEKLTPPPLPPKPSSLTGLAPHAVSTGSAPIRRIGDISSSMVDHPREHSPELQKSASKACPSSSAPVTEPQSEIKEVENQTVNWVGDYMYSVHQLCGRGGSANVYKCRNVTNGKDYAIREITIEFHGNLNKDSIKQEIAMMKKLDHPNIIKIYEVMICMSLQSWYMVLELCQGELLKITNDGKAVNSFDEDTCREYFQQLLLGAEYLHGHSLAHLDIKPGNLLISYDGKLKIADFGISQKFATGDTMNIMNNRRGTFPFMAPESDQDQYSGRRADIWSMGVTLFLMWNGEIPFAVPKNWTRWDYSSRVAFKAGTPESLKTLLNSMIELDPAKRITMDELRRDPWVTDNGKKPLKSKEENLGSRIEVTDEDRAKSLNTLAVMTKAAAMFRRVLSERRAAGLSSSEAVDAVTTSQDGGFVTCVSYLDRKEGL